VGEGGLVGCDADVEELGDLRELFEGWGGEVPVEEALFGVLAGVGAAVAAEDGGGVVGGVEADAEEMGVGEEGGIGGELAVELGEVAAHAGAEVGEGAAGVDEGEEDDFAVEVVEVDEVVALVEEGEVGDLIAGGGDVVLDGGFVVGLGLGGDDDVGETGVGKAVGGVGGALIGEEVGGDAVAGV